MALPGFQELSRRLVAQANDAVRRGDVTERGLARLLGYSQPHIHNVLQGTRNLQPALADALIEALPAPLDALLTPDELGLRRPAQPETSTAVPILEGRLGAGRPFPRLPARPRLRRYPPALLEGLVAPVAVQIDAADDSMWPFLWPSDWVLLDASPTARSRPRLENLYALTLGGKGFAARSLLIGERLLTVTDGQRSPKGPPPYIDIDDNIREIVQARIVWIGRNLRPDA